MTDGRSIIIIECDACADIGETVAAAARIEWADGSEAAVCAECLEAAPWDEADPAQPDRVRESWEVVERLAPPPPPTEPQAPIVAVRVTTTFAAAGTSPAAEPMTDERLSDQEERRRELACPACESLVSAEDVGGPRGDAVYVPGEGWLDSDRERWAMRPVGVRECGGCRERAAYRAALALTRGDSEAARAMVEADRARLPGLRRVPAWA